MNKKSTLYLDMDGVVADWAAGVEKIIGYRISDPKVYYPEEDWQTIRNTEHLFLDLPKMPRADEMVDLARKFRDELGWELLFLTAIPHYNDMHWSFYDKMMWAKRYYPDIPVHFGPYSKDKKRHCRPGDVLVDDRPDNCTDWTEAGGIAVEVKPGSYTSALQDLKQLLDKKQSLNNLKTVWGAR